MISSQAVFSAVTWAFFIQRRRSASARAVVSEAVASRVKPNASYRSRHPRWSSAIPDLTAGSRVEDVGRGFDVELGIAVDARRFRPGSGSAG